MEAVKYKPLGMRLIETGRITSDQLELALRRQERTGELLGEILCKLGFVSEDEILSQVAAEAGTEHIDLNYTLVEAEALKLIPEAFARTNKIFPFSLTNDTLVVAMANTFDVVIIDRLQSLTQHDIEAVSATESDIIKAIDRYYGAGFDIEDFIEDSIREAEGKTLNNGEVGLAEAAPVVKLVDQLMLKAVKDAATDIHLEAEESVFKVRYRIDGILRQGPSLPKILQPAITARIKVMANLNISEKRVPQDGRYNFYAGKKRINLRVSTFPTIFGESVVLRVLDKEKLVLGLENLGFSKRTLTLFRDVIQKPHGICLVTGPTGSGKTTTLYSTLSYINSLEKNVITLEDPVEYELQTINQCQINVKAGLTFATGLRAILRQDPDVIFVGEIRDSETLEMATRAALTGHLVFSTLHTNDAVGAIPRLKEMGIKPFILSSVLIGVLAQRLVRIICPQCKEKIPAPLELLERVGLNGKFREYQFYKGRGCEACYHTGYKGRIGIFEFLPITSTISQLIAEGGSNQKIRQEARHQRMSTMLEDGLRKAILGMTTLEEVLRFR